MHPAAGESRRPIRPIAYALFFLFFAIVIFSTHLPFVGLPYYWDELGAFVPAALDIFRDGAWIPHSSAPTIHPPAVMGYLAAAWSLFGYSPASTRCAMLLLASFAWLSAFLLAIELLRDVPGKPALLAAALLGLSPLFFAQSMMAQLDAPALLFSTLALLFFLQDRILLSAAVSVLLVLVKETGLIVPLVCALWLLHERRWRAALLYLAPLLPLAVWILLLARHTGHWMGNAESARYNLYAPLHPLRVGIALLRRLSFVLCADFHWIGAAAVLLAWRRSKLFQRRSWRVAASMVAAHVVLFALIGGAVLVRYLLPVMPIVYAAMAAALWQLSRKWRLIATGALLAGLAMSNFVNPPYPFPLENNLAFTDYIAVHQDAAAYLQAHYPGARVGTLWPMNGEISSPDFGFVNRAMAFHELADLTPKTLQSIDWSGVQVLALFPRDAAIPDFWRRILPRLPGVSREQVRTTLGFPPIAQFERHGQWVDIYVRPR